VAAGAVFAIACASVLAAFRRSRLVLPDKGPLFRVTCFGCFWIFEYGLFGWPTLFVYFAASAGCLSATAAFCMARRNLRRVWIPGVLALASQALGALACLVAGVPASAGTLGAAQCAGAALALCGMLRSHEIEK
jgi:hypothetical protein